MNIDQNQNTDFKPTQVSEFYKKYPYPKVDSIEYDFNLLDHFQYLSGQCFNYQIPRQNPERQGRMLIAGCGTREAVMWAFSLPHFHIDAIDLSENSIEISKMLASQLQLTNLRFIHANFELGEGIEGPYDFIHSFGVLHHLKSPETGLAHLESALAPNGLISIMVYNDANRLQYQRAQRVISLLTQDTEPAEKEACAYSIVENGSKVRNPLQRVFKTAVSEYQSNPAQFADTMLNPQEVSYTLPSLIDFLASSGLEITSPALPIKWQLKDQLTPEHKVLFEKLPLVEQMEIVDHLKAPLFWVLARRQSENQSKITKRPCSEDDDLFWDLVPLPLETGVFPVNQLRIQHPRALQIEYTHHEPPLISIRRGKTKQTFSYHKIAQTMIMLFDGQRTLREIGEIASHNEGIRFKDVQESLKLMLKDFIDLLSLGTPDFSRCHRCKMKMGIKENMST